MSSLAKECLWPDTHRSSHSPRPQWRYHYYIIALCLKSNKRSTLIMLKSIIVKGFFSFTSTAITLKHWKQFLSINSVKKIQWTRTSQTSNPRNHSCFLRKKTAFKYQTSPDHSRPNFAGFAVEMRRRLREKKCIVLQGKRHKTYLNIGLI